MAEAVVSSSLDELWLQVDQQYLLYLIAEDPATKKEHRKKLNVFIREYLHLAPQDKKYTFPQTAQIIRRSASIMPDFNPVKASIAWDAIAKYAINLVLQPWRKEFQELKLYCGYYKYNVDDSLVDPELMFELMGFYHVGDATMAITDILDPDKITTVSKDSFIASVECQILREIWEKVTPYYDFDWMEILEYRENHTGSAEQAVKTLKFRRRQLLYEQEIFRAEQEKAAGKRVPLDFVYGSNTGYVNRVFYNRRYSSPSHSRQAPANLPQVASPSDEGDQVLSRSDSQQALNAQDLDLSSGSHVQSQVMQESLSDSYVYDPNNRSFDSDSPVPTGQLIELDSTQFQVHEPPKEYLEKDDDTASNGEKWEQDETGSPSAKGKQRVRNDWRGKNVSESSKNKATDTEDISEGELAEEFQKVSISLNKTKEQKSKGTGQVGGSQVRERKASPVIKRDVSAPGPSRISYKKANDSEIEIYVESPKPKRKSKLAAEDDYDDDDDDDDSVVSSKWECITCTFLNTKDRRICQMCFKSKDPGAESKPQPRGGVVCKKCTLINEKNSNFCDACGKRLTYAAIYI